MKQPPRFESLDALRFFAFLKVFFLHLPWTGAAWLAYLKEGGGIGVQFFFVLSGFLISYLLWQERMLKGRIDGGFFLLKRVLRIWPLYFVTLLAAYCLIGPVFGNAPLPGQYEPDWRWSFSMLENYKVILEGGKLAALTPLSITPSLCIEEHFYLLTLVLFLLPARFFFPGVFTLTVLAPLLRFFLPRWFFPLHPETNELFSNFDLFGMGMLLGFHYAYYPDKWKQRLFRVSVLWKRMYCLLVLAVVIITPWLLQHFTYLALIWPMVLAVLFCGVLAVFMVNDPAFKIGTMHPLSRLGRISYGLYLLHLFPVLALMRIFPFEIDTWWSFLLFTTAALAGSFLLAGISYRLLEQPVMALRNRYKMKNHR